MIKHLTFIERLVVNRFLLETAVLPCVGGMRGWLAWPTWAPRQYNANNEACDMWTGACCCGAWHTLGK